MYLNWQDVQEQTSYRQHLNFQLVSHLQCESISRSVKGKPSLIPRKKFSAAIPLEERDFQLQKDREKARERRGWIDKLSESLVEEEDGLQAAGW